MKKKMLMTIGVLFLLTMVFFIGIQSYFHHKEIRFATERCDEVGGEPVVEKDFLALNYSFSCTAADN